MGHQSGCLTRSSPSHASRTGASGSRVELVHASRRELAEYDLAPRDFPLVPPIPSIVDTDKLAAIGWDSTPHADAISRTVDEHTESDRTGRHRGPDRERERQAIDGLTLYSG